MELLFCGSILQIVNVMFQLLAFFRTHPCPSIILGNRNSSTTELYLCKVIWCWGKVLFFWVILMETHKAFSNRVNDKRSCGSREDKLKFQICFALWWTIVCLVLFFWIFCKSIRNCQCNAVGEKKKCDQMSSIFAWSAETNKTQSWFLCNDFIFF